MHGSGEKLHTEVDNRLRRPLPHPRAWNVTPEGTRSVSACFQTRIARKPLPPAFRPPCLTKLSFRIVLGYLLPSVLPFFCYSFLSVFLSLFLFLSVFLSLSLFLSFFVSFFLYFFLSFFLSFFVVVSFFFRASIIGEWREWRE